MFKDGNVLTPFDVAQESEISDIVDKSLKKDNINNIKHELIDSSDFILPLFPNSNQGELKLPVNGNFEAFMTYFQSAESKNLIKIMDVYYRRILELSNSLDFQNEDKTTQIAARLARHDLGRILNVIEPYSKIAIEDNDKTVMSTLAVMVDSYKQYIQSIRSLAANMPYSKEMGVNIKLLGEYLDGHINNPGDVHIITGPNKVIPPQAFVAIDNAAKNAKEINGQSAQIYAFNSVKETGGIGDEDIIVVMDYAGGFKNKKAEPLENEAFSTIFRGYTTKEEKHCGGGLGLQLYYHLISSLGGKVVIDTTADGKIARVIDTSKPIDNASLTFQVSQYDIHDNRKPGTMIKFQYPTQK